MNWKRFSIALVVVFLGAYVLGYLINVVLLAQDYVNLPPGVIRAPQDMKMPFLVLGYLGFALGFVLIYVKAMDNGKPWLVQGAKYGITVWFMVSAYGWLISYAVQPISKHLAAKAMGFELIAFALLGALAAGIYRKQPAPAAKSAAA